MEEQIVTAYRAKLRRHQESMQSKILVELEEPKTLSSLLDSESQVFNPSSQSKFVGKNTLIQEESLAPKIITPKTDTQVSEELKQAEKTGLLKTIKKFISRIFYK